MTKTTAAALAAIRQKLGLKRISPRRLYMVNDGAYRWIGDRANLTTKDARGLAVVSLLGSHPDRSTPELQAEHDSIEYGDICGRVGCVASLCGAGYVSLDLLPESWQDGSALGPIKPL